MGLVEDDGLEEVAIMRTGEPEPGEKAEPTMEAAMADANDAAGSPLGHAAAAAVVAPQLQPSHAPVEQATV